MSTTDTVRAVLSGATSPAEAARAIVSASLPQSPRSDGGVWERFSVGYVLEASIVLVDGEGLDDFRRTVTVALREKFGDDCYAEEIYAETVIVYFYNGTYAGKCLQVGWSRNEDKSIGLGSEVLEVRRRTIYEPV